MASLLGVVSDDRFVLVTGANGFLGSHLVTRLLDAGRRVRALVRRTSDLRFLDPRAEVVRASLSEGLALVEAVRGAGAVYHAAGLVATHRPAAFREVNEEGTRILVRACRKAAPDLSRFVLVSSLAAAGPSRTGRPVREDDAPRPVSAYGRSKLAGERAAIAEAGSMPLVIVRPPVIYGPRDRDALAFFTLAARGFRPVFPREKYYSILHVGDAVRAIHAAGERPEAAGRLYHPAGPAYAFSRYLAEVAASLPARVRALPVPEWILPAAGAAADLLGRGLRLPVRPLFDKVREIRPDYWIADGARSRAELGFEPRVALAEGLRETAAFYRSAGWLPERAIPAPV